jgi:hypothetical protein
MAYATLSTKYSNIGNEQLARDNLTKDRSANGSLYIESHYYESATGQLDKAVHVYWEIRSKANGIPV